MVVLIRLQNGLLYLPYLPERTIYSRSSLQAVQFLVKRDFDSTLGSGGTHYTRAIAK